MREDPVSAEEVAHRRFSYAFRGFDTGEVRDYLERVAEELRSAVKRERELQRQVAAAEHRAAHPVVDEAVLTRTLGEETSRILTSAHEVARELKAKAEDNAARILREAHAEAQRIRASAEVVLVERTEEAELAADDIRSGARDEVEASLQQARQEASSIVAEAEVRAGRMVEDAEAASARVVSELGRRRRVAHAQIEQLRAGRERLLDAYRVVRRTLEEVVEELHRAEPEARLAAEAAARRAGIDAAHLEVADADADADVIEVEEVRVGASVGPAAAPSLGDSATGAVDAATAPPPTAFTTGPPGEAGEPDDKAGPEPIGEEPSGEGPVPPRSGEEDRGLAPLGRVEPLGGEPSPDSGVADEAPPVEEAPSPARPESGAQPEEAEREAGEPERVGTPPVSALFARIRADRAAAVTRAQEVLAADHPTAERPSTAPSPDHPPAATSEEPSTDGDEALLQRRDDALEGIISGLARRLKRVLQDEQNEVLDRLRSHRGHNPSELMPTSVDQVARYRLAGADLLEEAASAGVEFIAPGSNVAPDIADLVDGLAESLIGPLRRRLQQAMRAEDGDDPATLAEPIGAAYREWKAQRIDRLAGDAAISAFSRGTAAAVPGAALRWVVDDDDGQCPDCDDNALAGPTPVGEAYPTGQQHPPAHAGCRCLLVSANT